MSDSNTKDLVVLKFNTVIEGAEARALRRLAERINRVGDEPKSENKVALGLLRFLLESLPDEHNCVVGFDTTKK